MEYLIGVSLGIVIGVGTALIGMDRDRALYPAMLIVIAAYYVLFAVMGGSSNALLMEVAVSIIFVALAVAGFKSTLWITAIGIVGHGLFDLVHGLFIQNPGVPVWWPGFCSSIDVVLGVFLGWLLLRDRVRATDARP